MATYTTDAPTTLFQVAAAQLGDALLWWQIATLNGLTDPDVGANVALLLPPIGQPDNDGLPPQ